MHLTTPFSFLSFAQRRIQGTQGKVRPTAADLPVSRLFGSCVSCVQGSLFELIREVIEIMEVAVCSPRPSTSVDQEFQVSLNSATKGDNDNVYKQGYMDFGCLHYRRRCKIRAPCCDEIFDCRHCHNEAKNSMDVNVHDRHVVPRHEIKKVICSLCGTEQDVQQTCVNCGVCMGKYFCGKCNFFDDDDSKQQYHCEACGICRTGGGENFFHCYKCGCCYSTQLKNSHPCVEGAMHQNCPVCLEFLFESTKDINVLRCGHTIHLHCLLEMRDHSSFACPLCSKSVFDMTEVWEKYDEEIEATPMPQTCQKRLVWILCNDCGVTSEVPYHVVGHKCQSCRSYNTRRTRRESSTGSCSPSF